MNTKDFERYLVRPSHRVSINDFNSGDTSLFPEGKQLGKQKLVEINQELSDLQDILVAENKHKLLIILQAMDTGGKDGTIRKAFSGFNPQGVRVVSYKVPTSEELAHDFLWRVHKQVPANGEITIFNRSHYEDVLAVRVHELVPEEIWKKRYWDINNFERILTNAGTTILKFFLNISKDEQKNRLEERLSNPKKNWKFNPADIKERKLWDEYMEAYEAVLNKTSTNHAPWYVIPADKNWYRNLMVASITLETLRNLKMSYPLASANLEKIKVK